MSAMESQITCQIDCLLNRLFKAQIKENIKDSRHWLLWGGCTGDRHKWPVTRKKFPFDDVIMWRVKLVNERTDKFEGFISLQLHQEKLSWTNLIIYVVEVFANSTEKRNSNNIKTSFRIK